MSDSDILRIIKNIPSKYIGGSIGALLAPLLIREMLGAENPVLQAISVPIGWTLGYNLAPKEKEIARSTPITTFN